MAYISQSQRKGLNLACAKLLAQSLFNNLRDSSQQPQFIRLQNFDFSGIDQINFLLLKKLQSIIEADILEANSVSKLRLETLKQLKKLSPLELSQICSSHFCMFERTFTQIRSCSPLSEDFSLIFWLSAWEMAKTTPLRAKLCFNLTYAEIEQIGQMNASQILEFAKEPRNRQFKLRHSQSLLLALIETNEPYLRLLQVHHILSSQDEDDFLRPSPSLQTEETTFVSNLLPKDKKLYAQLLHLVGVQRVDILNFLQLKKNMCISYIRNLAEHMVPIQKRTSRDINPKTPLEGVALSIFAKLYHRIGSDGIFKAVNVEAFVQALVITADILDHPRLESLKAAQHMPHASKLLDLAQAFCNSKIEFNYCYSTRSFFISSSEDQTDKNAASSLFPHHKKEINECQCSFCQSLKSNIKMNKKHLSRITELLHSPYDPERYDRELFENSSLTSDSLSGIRIPEISFKKSSPTVSIREAVATKVEQPRASVHEIKLISHPSHG